MKNNHLEGLDELVNSYLKEHHHDVLLSPYNGLMEFAKLVCEWQKKPVEDLDETAKRIAYDVCKQLPNGEGKDGIVYYAILAAIAGAEWMAGQFQKIEDIAEDHSTNFEKMAKEAEALDALADWWVEKYCNKDAGFDESSFHIGFCLGWQQHEKGMTAV